MSFEDLTKVLSDISMADSMTYWIVGGLTVAATALMRAILPMKGLSLIFAPAVFWGGLAGVYAFGQLGLVYFTDRNAQIVLSGTTGMTVALIVMVLLTRAVTAALQIRKPLTTAQNARA